MGYKIDYSAMEALLSTYSSLVNVWEDGISAVMKNESAIVASTNIAGNNADRMKAYLNTAYTLADAALSALLEMFRQNYLLYTESYYQQIDAAEETHIEESELNELHSDLQAKRSTFQQIGFSAEKAVNSISDIVTLPSLDISRQDSELGSILASLNDLNSKISSFESAHVSADFTEIDSLISQLESFLLELSGQSKEYKTSFLAENFIALSSVSGLALATQKAYDVLQSQESDVAQAVKNLEKRFEQRQEELEKRKKEAEWAKIGVNVAVGFISAVALATTGPVGAIVVGAVSGAVSASFSAAADAYVESGWDTQKWNMDRIMIHGCIGAFTGMVGGMVSPGAGACVKAGIKGLSSAFEGVASSSYDQLEMHGNITDVRAIAEDAILKGTSTFVGSWIGSAVSDNVEAFVKKNDTIKDLAENVVGGSKHFGAVLAVEGSSEIISGTAKRFSSTAIEETGGFVSALSSGKSIEEAYTEHRILSKSFQDATDIKKIISDAGSAVSTAATDNPLYASEKKLKYRSDDYYLFGDSPDLSGKEDGWQDWNSEEYDRMMAKLADMDARGDDARNYEIFGDPRSLAAQRQSAINKAWAQERQLVLQGRGTRNWTVSQQEELIRTGKVSGFDGSHMLDASSNPLEAGNPDNIQFLTYEEHIYGAHGGNTHTPTTGWFNTETGETSPIKAGHIPHRETTAFELTDKFDYSQLDIAEQLGSSFGYGRGSKSE